VSITGNGSKEPNKEKECIFTLIRIFFLETGSMAKNMDKELMSLMPQG
jgi:hypothetical protein